MRFIIKYLAICIILWSCSSQKHASKNDLEEKTQLVISFNQLSDSTQDLPEYTLELYSNRQMYLTALKNMDKQGKFMRTLNEKEMNQVIKSFTDANFFKLQNEYFSTDSTMQTRYLYFAHNGSEKKVKYNNGTSEKLIELEYLLQSFLDRVGWEKMTW